jgi:DNA-binding MarR family transcriptional regulator
MTSPSQLALAAQTVRDACLCLHVQRAARLLGRQYDEALRDVELTNEQFSLLVALAQPEPPSMSELAAALGMDRTTLTASLKPLERRGLVDTVSSELDRRVRLVSLTQPGHRLLQAALPAWRKLQSRISRELPAGISNEELLSGLRALSFQ